MARPIIHIGFHKSATSWFQKRYYPAATSHRLVDRLIVRQTLLGGTAFDFDPRAARERLGFEESGQPLLICDEDLSGFLHNSLSSGYVAKDVARRIHAVAPEAQIVILVRAQPAAALSCYEQYVREGGTATARRYLFAESYRHTGKSRPFKYPRFDFAQLDYRGLIAHYDTLFGAANVHVFAYEQLVHERERLLGMMAERLELVVDPARVIDARVNASYRSGLLPVARAMNLFTARSVAGKWTLIHVPYWYPVRKLLLEQLNRLPLFGRRPRPESMLGRETVLWIQARFWQTNRWLAERMQMDLEAFGYAVDPPTVPVARPGRTRLFAWLRE